jgi:AraC family transcriptional regulator
VPAAERVLVAGDGHGLDALLQFIHANLDQPLTLEEVARRAGLSPFHFHREFKRETGQTLARYIEQLRLERAAHALLFHDANLLCIALDCGYNGPETFSRAFRRRFGMPPAQFRRRGRFESRGVLPDRSRIDSAQGGYELSATRVQELRPTQVACIRHLGPYETVPDTLWPELGTWLQRRKIRVGPFVGIGHDNPQTAPQGRARYDAGVLVDAAFRGDERVTCRSLPRGPYGVTSHVGPYATLPDAFPRLYAQVAALEDFDIVGLPVLEVYHTREMQTHRTINQTDIYVPVSPRSAQTRRTP